MRLPAATVVALALVVGACSGDHGSGDHGPDVPRSAAAALDCAGTPNEKGRGNYDTGPESVQDGPRAALDDWFDAEPFTTLPQAGYDEAARRDGEALFTFSTQGLVVAALVVRDDTRGPGDDQGWGVASYAACDPAEWPPGASEGLGVDVWTNADGDRVPTSTVQSFRGPEHCGWQDMTFLLLGEDGEDGEFYGTPAPELQELLTGPYAAHVDLPPDARDTGYQRDGRGLWLAADRSAAYLVTGGGGGDGDAERWPAPTRGPLRCA